MTTQGSIHSMSTVSSRSSIAVLTFSIHFLSSVAITACSSGTNDTHGETYSSRTGMTTKGSIHSLSTVGSRSSVAVMAISIRFISLVVVSGVHSPWHVSD